MDPWKYGDYDLKFEMWRFDQLVRLTADDDDVDWLYDLDGPAFEDAVRQMGGQDYDDWLRDEDLLCGEP